MAERQHVLPRIAIIGGGITGLAAAHRLIELLPQAELALFESSSRLGGILDTIHRDGFLVERSADSFQTKLPHAVDLCRRLGIADQLLPTDDARRRALVLRAGRLLPVPAGFYLMSPSRLGPILKSPVLSLPGKLRLLMEPLIRRGPAAKGVQGSGFMDEQSNVRNPEPRTLNPHPDESIASFATRRLGREVFERLVQPLVAGIYTGDAAQLSMAATLPEFLQFERDYGSLLRATLTRRTGHNSDPSNREPCGPHNVYASGARYALFAAPPDGMASLVTALANRLSPKAIHLNTPVTRVTRQANSGWQLDVAPSTPPSALRPPPFQFDALILAVPTHAAAQLLQPVDADLAAALADIEYASCTVVSLACRRSQIGHHLDSFGFVVPRIENRRIIAASFASQKFPGRAPADGTLIRVFIGGALQAELADLPDDELQPLVREELADIMQFTGEPLWTDIARWPRSMPQYHVGHLDRVARIEQLAALHPGLALAGNAYHGVGIPQCIHSGEEAAQRIAGLLFTTST